MKIVCMILMIIFLSCTFAYGLPFTLVLQGSAWNENALVFTTTHETVASILKRSSSLEARCPDQTEAWCVRPVDYSTLAANLPVHLEACGKQTNRNLCDGVELVAHLTTKDLLTAGLRL